MRNTEQDRGWVVAAVVVVLLLGVIGCTASLNSQGASNESSAIVDADDVTHATASAEESAAASDLAPTAGTAPALPAVDVAASVAATPIEAPAEPALRIHQIDRHQRDGREAVTLRLSRVPDELRSFSLTSPNRLVLDIEGPMAPGTFARTHDVADGTVERVRIGTYERKVRVVLDLAGELPAYMIEREPRNVTVLLDRATLPTDERTVYIAPGIAALGIESARTDPTHEPVTTESVATAEPLEDTTTVESATDEAIAATEDAASADVAPAASPPTVAVEVQPIAPQPVAPDVAPRLAAPPISEPEDLPDALDAEPELVAAVPEPPAESLPAYALPVLAARERTERTVTPIDGGTITTEDDRDDSRPYVGQRISLDFKDADIQNVLRILADVSGLNIITTEDVQGKLTMRLVDVPWDQALEAILKAKGLDMVRDGNIVRISTLGKLKEERDAQRKADEAQVQAEPLKVRYIKVNYAKADEELVKKVQEVLTDRGSSTWDERTNTIVVRDIARGIVDAEELVGEFDTQTPQILIEANIVEATESFARDLGVQWGYTYRASPETGNAPGVNFPGRVTTGGGSAAADAPPGTFPFIADFPAKSVAPGAGAVYDLFLGSLDGSSTLGARLTALEREGKGKIISRPRVVTLNNVPAKIESLEILRVRLPSTGTVISTGAGGVAGSSQNATEEIRTGITLKVTPQLSSDGYVFLDVFAKSSTLQSPEQSQAPSPDAIPNEISREANSHVLIKDGETFVLGGVFRNVLNDDDIGVPYLRSIPVLGWAFKNRNTIDNRQELLVFITPRAVRARGTEDLASLPPAAALWQNRVNP